jgi:hypothetical protein
MERMEEMGRARKSLIPKPPTIRTAGFSPFDVAAVEPLSAGSAIVAMLAHPRIRSVEFVPEFVPPQHPPTITVGTERWDYNTIPNLVL